jgi:hypothetical protein
MKPIDFAYEMYKREHDRWRDWSIFFLGSIGSIFLVWKEFDYLIPIWIASILSMFMSLFWIFVSLSIRSTTDAWKETIIELENTPENTKSMEIFYDKLKLQKGRFQDLKETVWIFGETWWKKELFSVTRTLTWVGIFSFIFFLIVTIVKLKDC